MNLSIVIHEFLRRYSRVVLPRVGVGVGVGGRVLSFARISRLVGASRTTATATPRHRMRAAAQGSES